MIVFELDVGDQVVVQDYRPVWADRAEFTGHGVFMIDRADGMSPAPQADDPVVVLRLRRLSAGAGPSRMAGRRS